MNIGLIKKLIEIMEESQLAEIEISGLWSKIRLSKNVHYSPPVRAAATDEHQTSLEKAREADKSVQAVHEPGTDNLVPIVSPVVGTFYRAPAPEAAPFVEVGTVVSPGQTVCIVEAMKIMNEIEAEIRGKVVDILAQNAQPVEYGQTLFLLEPL
jgi:acetyl-CoA carboxylase biotin carboxyl carrier protein